MLYCTFEYVANYLANYVRILCNIINRNYKNWLTLKWQWLGSKIEAQNCHIAEFSRKQFNLASRVITTLKSVVFLSGNIHIL